MTEIQSKEDIFKEWSERILIELVEINRKRKFAENVPRWMVVTLITILATITLTFSGWIAVKISKIDQFPITYVNAEIYRIDRDKIMTAINNIIRDGREERERLKRELREDNKEIKNLIYDLYKNKKTVDKGG